MSENVKKEGLEALTNEYRNGVEPIDKEKNALESCESILSKIESIFEGLKKAADVYKKFLDTYSNNMESDINSIMLQNLSKEEESKKIEEISKYYREKAEELRKDALKSNATMREMGCKMGWAMIILAGFGVIAKAYLQYRNNGSGTKLMTMDDFVRKARPNAKLEHHYIEVLRALGEMKLLKKEGSEEYDEELYKLLIQLKGILEALFFKGSYGITVESGAKKLRKLVGDIAGDGNFTNDWMKYLDEDERRTLKEQANEIMESIPSAKTKKRNVER